MTILGSGSGGNCTYIESGDTRILVDAGFSARQTRARLASISRAPEGLTGILITHEHVDHINGLPALAGKLGIPVYCNRLTREALEFQLEVKFDCRIFSTGSSFDIGELSVDTFTIPHDASDPVGFLIHTPAGNIGFLTDLGHATKLALERVKSATALLLETNHDLKMLQESTRPWSLKQRIAGRHGHLSNLDAADALEKIMSDGLVQLYLGHLSRECNLPELANSVIMDRLETMAARHVEVELTHQGKPCRTFCLDTRKSLANSLV